MSKKLSFEKIFQIGFGFWNSKTLLSALELGLFTELAKGPLDAKSLQERLGLHPRGYLDFFDGLVALGLLERKDGAYSNTPETDHFLDKNKDTYIGGCLEMINDRIYGFWGSLTEALRTGEPQNEAKSGEDLFSVLYSKPERLQGFLSAMTGLSKEAGKAIAQKFPWKKYQTFIDIGAAQGGVPVELAKAHPHLKGGGFDLPVAGPIFEQYIQKHGLADRLKFYPGDFIKDALPSSQVLLMGHILHDWDLEIKKMLLQKAYQALPPGGVLILHEAIIDDERNKNHFGLMMSLNMLIETKGGFDYTGADAINWLKEAGFQDAYVEPLMGPDSMVVGVK